MSVSRVQVRRIFSAAAVVAVGVAAWIALRGAERHLARAGGVAVTEEEFVAAYRPYLLASGVPDSPRLRHTFIQDMIGTRLLVREADLAGTPAYAARHAVARRKLLIDAYVRHAALDTIKVTDYEVRQLFIRAQTSVTARHLYARTHEAALALKRRLDQGESFEALAREVFRDAVLRESGGLLPPFTFDETDAAFEDAAFALAVGEVSDPVRTARGYSIIKVEGRELKPLITEQEFAARRLRFEAYARLRREEAARSLLVRGVARQQAVTLVDEGAEALLTQIAGPAIAVEGGADAALLDLPLLTFGPGATPWTVGDFRRHARFASERQRAVVASREDLFAFAQGLVVNETLALRAESLRLDRTEAFRQALEQAMFDYEKAAASAQLGRQVEVDERAARAYFDQAAPGEFMNEAAIAVSVRRFASEAQARVHTHAGAFANTPSYLYNRAELGPWADTLFAAGEGTALGPLPSRDGYVVLLTGRVQEATPMTFEESKKQIITMLRMQERRAARQAAYAALAAAHRISIDVKRLAEVALY